MSLKKKSNKAAVTPAQETVPAETKAPEVKAPETQDPALEEKRAKWWKVITVFWDTYKTHQSLTLGGKEQIKQVKTFLERKVMTDVSKRPTDKELQTLAIKLKDCTPDVMVEGKGKAKPDVPEAPATIEFPDTYKLDNVTLLSRVKTDDWATIKKLVEDEITIIALAEWNKEQIEQDKYGEMYNVPAPKDGFPDDFDAMEVVVITSHAFVTESKYTEALNTFFDKDVKYDELKRRSSNGLPFELYTAQTIEEPAVK